MSTSSHNQWKGCGMCKPWKHRGASVRKYPWAARRQLGKKRRLRRDYRDE